MKWSGTERAVSSKAEMNLRKGPGTANCRQACAEISFSPRPWRPTKEVGLAYQGCHLALKALIPHIPCRQTTPAFLLTLFLGQATTKEGPANDDESRGFPDRAPMFSLAENGKVLVSQSSDSLCSQGLAQHYSGMANPKQSPFLSLHTKKHLLRCEEANP